MGLCPNIPHDNDLVVIWKALDAREDKTVSTDIIFDYSTSFYKQLKGDAIVTKMAPSYALIFMGHLEEKLLKYCDKKPLVW